MSDWTLPTLRIATVCQVKDKKAFVKFSKRKDANSIQKVKQTLKCMDLSSIGMRYPMYINEGLRKQYKMLWRKYKKLCANKFIHPFRVSNGPIILKLSDNERLYIITHINDLKELFPGYELIRDEEQVIYFQLCFIFKLILLSSNMNVFISQCYNRMFSSHFVF